MTDYLDTDFEPLYIDKPHKIVRNGYSHYPILNGVNELLGILEEDDIESWDNNHLVTNPQLLVQLPFHPDLCMHTMKENGCNVLFLVEDGKYQGAISYSSLVHYFQDHNRMTQESAVLTLFAPGYVFSLSEVARIAESEGNAILSYSSHWLDMENLEIKLIFQHNDLKRIIGILENKGYHIVNLYNEAGIQEHLKERYENLMSYLNV